MSRPIDNYGSTYNPNQYQSQPSQSQQKTEKAYAHFSGVSLQYDRPVGLNREEKQQREKDTISDYKEITNRDDKKF